MPVNFHCGASATQRTYIGGSPWPTLDPNNKLAIGSAKLQLGNARILANMILSAVGTLNGHLDVHVCSAVSLTQEFWSAGPLSSMVVSSSPPQVLDCLVSLRTGTVSAHPDRLALRRLQDGCRLVHAAFGRP